MITGSKRKAGVPKPTAVVEESEEGEVRPYPGLVDGIDALLLDGDGDGGGDDLLVSVSCGARYTLALSRKRRAFVWGQVAPPTDKTGGGGTQAGPFCGSSKEVSSSKGTDGNAPLHGSYSTPRELRIEELVRAATAAIGSAQTVGRVAGTGQQCCRLENARGATVVDNAETGAGGGGSVRRHDERDSSSRWRISTAGCGPWYIVFGLEEKGSGNRRGARLTEESAKGAVLLPGAT